MLSKFFYPIVRTKLSYRSDSARMHLTEACFLSDRSDSLPDRSDSELSQLTRTKTLSDQLDRASDRSAMHYNPEFGCSALFIFRPLHGKPAENEPPCSPIHHNHHFYAFYENKNILRLSIESFNPSQIPKPNLTF